MSLSLHLIWAVQWLWQTETLTDDDNNVLDLLVTQWLYLRFCSRARYWGNESKTLCHINMSWNSDLGTSSSDHDSVLVCISRSEVTQDLLSWHMSLIFILLSWVCVIQCAKTETPKCSSTVKALRYYLLSMSFMKALLCRSPACSPLGYNNQ